MIRRSWRRCRPPNVHHLWYCRLDLPLRCWRAEIGAGGILDALVAGDGETPEARYQSHIFRDAAATFIADTTPEQAPLAAGILQHRNLQITRNHYVPGSNTRCFAGIRVPLTPSLPTSRTSRSNYAGGKTCVLPSTPGLVRPFRARPRLTIRSAASALSGMDTRWFRSTRTGPFRVPAACPVSNR